MQLHSEPRSPRQPACHPSATTPADQPHPDRDTVIEQRDAIGQSRWSLNPGLWFRGAARSRRSITREARLNRTQHHRATGTFGGRAGPPVLSEAGPGRPGVEMRRPPCGGEGQHDSKDISYRLEPKCVRYERDYAATCLHVQ